MGIFVSNKEIINIVNDLKQNNIKTVLTNGCFDILHTGHTRYLQSSRNLGDKLIVLLNSDKSVKSIKGASRPINNELDRAEILCALTCVDYVSIFDDNSPVELIKAITPDIYTKGADYTIETLPEASELLPLGIDIKFITLVQGKSTTLTINKMKTN